MRSPVSSRASILVDAVCRELASRPPPGVEAAYVAAFCRRNRRVLVAEVSRALPKKPRVVQHPRGTMLKVTHPDGLVGYWIKGSQKWHAIGAGGAVGTEEGGEAWLTAMPHVVLGVGPGGNSRESRVKRWMVMHPFPGMAEAGPDEIDVVQPDPRRPEIRRGTRYLLRNGGIVLVEHIRPHGGESKGTYVKIRIEKPGRHMGEGAPYREGDHYDQNSFAFQGAITAALP